MGKCTHNVRTLYVLARIYRYGTDNFQKCFGLTGPYVQCTYGVVCTLYVINSLAQTWCHRHLGNDNNNNNNNSNNNNYNNNNYNDNIIGMIIIMIMIIMIIIIIVIMIVTINRIIIIPMK